MTIFSSISSSMERESAEQARLLAEHERRRADFNEAQIAKPQHQNTQQQLAPLVSSLKTEDLMGKPNETRFKLTNQLASQGAACRAEGHEATIARQRAAMTELRQRMRDAQLLQSPYAQNALSNTGADKSSAMARELISLRRELAELRAQRMVSETLPPNIFTYAGLPTGVQNPAITANQIGQS
ncbi:unnamed protein product [Protopolystoma xenopodis]|uniref:Uncharacterized protein n=1 Tax=Protopolystoma xenopodis TaxID=117903 RepID=A0A448WCS9_9PLAT|nr:unnamed protein product [Protopolystoma xenopodis]